jgi:hypothetical protein
MAKAKSKTSLGSTNKKKSKPGAKTSSVDKKSKNSARDNSRTKKGSEKKSKTSGRNARASSDNRPSSRNRTASQSSGGGAGLFIILAIIGLGTLGGLGYVFMGDDETPSKNTTKKTSKPNKKKAKIPTATKKKIYAEAGNNEEKAFEEAKKKYPKPDGVTDVEDRNRRKKVNSEKLRLKRQMDQKVADRYGVTRNDVANIVNDGILGQF